ncbi:MAG: 1-acyl-sn-glycerol-3-phosphate acyltransferase [Verrucomicrobiae bacterium]|nr:1-acyl-sn-glycerol-3-phosphate acyltransferase [Verrucomicrobiae bacterium]
MEPIYRLGYTLSNLVARLYFRRRVIHPEKLAVPGGCLVVANHTSFLDPPMIGSAFPEAIHYMARKTLFSNKVADWIYRHCNAIPVNQERPELATIKRILQLVDQGEKVLIFPEGERTRDGQLKEKGAPGIGMLIAKSKKPILPVRLYGAYEAFPRGAKIPKPSRLTVVAGDLLDLSELIEDADLKGKELYQALSDRAMEAIAELKLPEVT